MNPTLRVATPEDAPLIRQVYAYYIQNTVATFNEVLKPEAAYRESIAALLKTYPYLIAEEGGRLLGFCCAEPLRAQSGYRYTAEMTIYLHPDTPRHSGVGRLLYSALLPILTAQGFCNLYAVISSTNEESLGLHRSFGFEEAARFENSAYKHGQWLTAVWMHKTLHPPIVPPPPLIPFEDYRSSHPELFPAPPQH